jgi:hypothetical protein
VHKQDENYVNASLFYFYLFLFFPCSPIHSIKEGIVTKRR